MFLTAWISPRHRTIMISRPCATTTSPTPSSRLSESATSTSIFEALAADAGLTRSGADDLARARPSEKIAGVVAEDFAMPGLGKEPRNIRRAVRRPVGVVAGKAEKVLDAVDHL